MTNDISSSDELTIPSRDQLRQATAPPEVIPWALLGYFEGDLDLIQDLAGRYPQLSIMSLFNVRTAGSRVPRGMATIATQDGASSLIIEVDMQSLAVQFTFIVGSMIGVRFRPGAPSPLDRAAWLEPMRREQGEVAFLWNAQRWSHDYLIGAATRSFTYLFAFSPNGVQAAARLTPEVSRKLTDWLGGHWKLERG
ncbi:MAG: hypothetical protein IPK19_26095 [Chloroflexi bacterium]|nr:hypothetical protein [Chloroflexota bacterium]